MTTITTTTPPGRRSGSRAMVVAICFAAIVFDGYDLIIYGSTIPALLSYEPWSLSPAQVGAIGGYALLGMLFGAVASGPLADRFGRRRLFLGCLTLYSVMMILAALAPNPAALGVFRFIAGLGFGGIAPVAIAIVVEIARPHERQRLNAIMLAGMPIGGVIAALSAIAFIDHIGFRGLWAFGGLALVTVAPLAWWFLPETAGSAVSAQKDRTSAIRRLTEGRQISALAFFSIANFAGFLLVFGLNTWLPELMRKADYTLGSALALQLLLNLGAVAGGITGSMIADRIGARRVAPAAFSIATIAILTMAATPPTPILALATIIAGAGSIGTQIILFGYVATYFGTSVRATALGLTTGVGRLGAVCGPTVGGFLLASGLATVWVFGFFGAVAIVGGIACLLVPRARRPEGAKSASMQPARVSTATE